MNTYKNTSFLKLALRFGIIFLIVITLIKIVVSIFSDGGIKEMIAINFSAENWQSFVVSNLGISILYGILMAGYYKFIKK